MDQFKRMLDVHEALTAVLLEELKVAQLEQYPKSTILTLDEVNVRWIIKLPYPGHKFTNSHFSLLEGALGRERDHAISKLAVADFIIRCLTYPAGLFYETNEVFNNRGFRYGVEPGNYLSFEGA